MKIHNTTVVLHGIELLVNDTVIQSWIDDGNSTNTENTAKN
jgi:hypothetical protein